MVESLGAMFMFHALGFQCLGSRFEALGFRFYRVVRAWQMPAVKPRGYFGRMGKLENIILYGLRLRSKLGTLGREQL